MDEEPPALDELAQSAPEVLITASSVFPFILFPDTITIDREKMTIINRFFFGVAKVISVPIQDILSVEENIGPFFGSLKIITRFYDNPAVAIQFLRRQDTIKIKGILAGYIIVSQKKISCHDIPKDELTAMLYRLGTGQAETA